MQFDMEIIHIKFDSHTSLEDTEYEDNLEQLMINITNNLNV